MHQSPHLQEDVPRAHPLVCLCALPSSLVVSPYVAALVMKERLV